MSDMARPGPWLGYTTYKAARKTLGRKFGNVSFKRDLVVSAKSSLKLLLEYGDDTTYQEAVYRLQMRETELNAEYSHTKTMIDDLESRWNFGEMHS